MKDRKGDPRERIQWVLNHLQRGDNKSAREAYIEEFGLCQTQYYQDRKIALSILRDLITSDVEDWRNDLIVRLEGLYEKNLDNPKNQNVCLNILQTLAKLTGNYDDKLTVKTDDSFSIKWSKEEDEQSA